MSGLTWEDARRGGGRRIIVPVVMSPDEAARELAPRLSALAGERATASSHGESARALHGVPAVTIDGYSGSGKSTIINYLLTQNLNLAFSISATSRPPRGTEQNGVEYFFLTPDEFRSRIANDEFLEYEEVYQDRFYGTLKAQVEKQLAAGQNVVFDVDVVGGCNIKKFYGERALSVFIQPPSVEELRKRLIGRGTDAPEVIESRVAKAEYELGFAPKFDTVIVNDDLETAKAEALKVITQFLNR